MRLFAAIPMPEPARRALLGVLATLEGTSWPVRWVGEGNLHLTIKFYGEVPEPAVAEVSTRLTDAVRGTPALPLHLDGVDAFPGLRRPKVIWAAVGGPPALELMQHRVEREAAVVGYPPDGKPFRPHITLGRVKSGAALPGTAPELLGQIALDLAFEATQVVLFESRLTRAGAEHTAKLTLDLAGGRAA